MSEHFQPCIMYELPPERRAEADALAVSIRAENRQVVPRNVGGQPRAAVVVSKYWGTEGVDLTVGFLESVSTTTKDNILRWMNDWGAHGKVEFRWSQDNPKVRITLARGSNNAAVGTDLLLVPWDQPTMSLVPDMNLKQYVWHETMHHLGMYPHGHQLRGVVEDIDPEKAYAFYGSVYHYSRGIVDGNVLETSIPDSHLYQTVPDRNSISSYLIPDEILRPGAQPIHGGRFITPTDAQMIATIYPKSPTPPAPSAITTKEQWHALKARGQVFCEFFQGQPPQEHESSANVTIGPEVGASITCKLAIVQVLPSGGLSYFAESPTITVKPGQGLNTGVAKNPGSSFIPFLVFPDGIAFDEQVYHP